VTVWGAEPRAQAGMAAAAYCTCMYGAILQGRAGGDWGTQGAEALGRELPATEPFSLDETWPPPD